MLVNSSSTTNASVQVIDCDFLSDSLVVFAFNICRGVFLLPLSVFVLYLGFRQWRQQRSFKAASHFDIFTYHQAVMELIWGLGALLYTLGVYLNLSYMITGGKILSTIIFFGETLFHTLTCLERYLAVVHPVTYRGLQHTHGATIRNGSIVLSWLVTWMWNFVLLLHHYTIPVVSFLCFLISSFLIILLCSLFVLCALIRRGPGEEDRNKRQMDQIKQKAFFTVSAILGVVFMWFVAFLVATATKEAKVFTDRNSCVIMNYVMWFSLPSSCILPLLYLHKKGLFF